MTEAQAKRIAKKYVKDEADIISLAIDLLEANRDGYKEAGEDLMGCIK